MFAARTLSEDCARSYVAYGRRVERELGVDLDSVNRGSSAILALLQRLESSGAPAASVRNCGSALKLYAAYRMNTDDGMPDALPAFLPPAAAIFRAATQTPSLEQASVRDLLMQYGAILGELRQRGITRTGNGPIGDYAETLYAPAFNWSLNANSTAGCDAVDGNGVRYQIKARRITALNPSRQLSAIRRLEEGQFDMLAAVLFSEAFGIERAVLIPRSIVGAAAKKVAHTNSWRLMLSDRVMARQGVDDVTEAIRSAHAQM